MSVRTFVTIWKGATPSGIAEGNAISSGKFKARRGEGVAELTDLPPGTWVAILIGPWLDRAQADALAARRRAHLAQEVAQARGCMQRVLAAAAPGGIRAGPARRAVHRAAGEPEIATLGAKLSCEARAGTRLAFQTS